MSEKSKVPTRLPDPPYLLEPWLRVDPASGQLIEASRLKAPPVAGHSIDLAAARNEYVSFQVIVPADWLGPKLRLSLGGLDKAAAIGAAELDWFCEWPNKGAEAWVPDALIPSASAEAALKLGLLSRIKRPRVAGLWVDLFVPAEAKPGAYAATLRVQSEAAQSADLGVNLRVWPFAIGDECHVTADMNSYSGSFVTSWPGMKENPDILLQPGARQILHAYYRLAHEHRSMIHTLNYSHSGSMTAGFAPDLVGAGDQIRVKSWTLYDRCWGALFDGSAFRNTRRGAIPVPFSYTPFNFQWPASFVHYGQPGYGEMWRRIGAQYADHLRDRGWTKTKFEIFFNHKKRYRFFPFDGDETRFLKDEAIFKEMFELAVRDLVARKDVRIIYRTDSSWSIGVHSLSDVADIFDLWVINSRIGGCFEEGIGNLTGKGHDVWFYGGVPGYGADLISMARWPIVPWMRGANGFTPWLCTGAGDRPLVDGPAGEGRTALFYPGAELGLDGPIPVIRTKVMRNAMQTVEYLWELAARRGGDRKETWQLANRALGVGPSAWWSKPDPFMKRPPHTWSNADFSTAPQIDHWGHSDPRDFEKLRLAAADALAAKG